ncbi:MAG TPA: heme ABC exporter ATP-binding protein CcmA [Candidatus Krumholzibacteria bacterium]|nr:heme ABC exporter ATP-binding protein CcmA [Candidatus Krumholzibacteria bacterium]
MSDLPIALACRGLTKRYGRVTALRSVDLSVPAGDCVALFGRNGAGKTTLLQIIGSLIASYEGSAEVFGQRVKRADAEHRRALGLVLHDTCLYLDLSVLDNLRFFGRLYRLPDPDARAHELLQEFDLEHRAHSVARELSRGMKQRLALARAVVHHPRLLLLDEPFTGLDELSSQSLSGMLSKFTKDGGTVLMSTHDVERAFDSATRAVILDRGVITFDRSTQDLDAATFRHAYWNVLFTGATPAGAGA